jgi:hypothetical protein
VAGGEYRDRAGQYGPDDPFGPDEGRYYDEPRYYEGGRFDYAPDVYGIDYRARAYEPYGRRPLRGGNIGRGPRGYTRSDQRILEDVSDRLTDDWYIDASDIEVSVSNAEVTLSGSVDSRDDKRRAEDLAESVPGVRDVQNNLRIQSGMSTTIGSTRTANNEPVRRN